MAGGATVTYAELAERTDRLASWLATGGVRRGDRIAVCAANGLVHFDAYLAAARIGAAAVPVPTGMAAPEVARIVADVLPALALADAAGAGALRAAGVDVVVEGSRRYGEALAAPSAAAVVPMPEPSDAALIIYTSGTGGRPRGVCLSQAALTCNAAMTTAAQRFGSHEVYLTSTPLYHTSAAARVFTMLDGAHTHVVLRRFDPAGWLEAVEVERVTSTIAVPTQIRRILDHDGYHPARSASLRLLVYGTAASAPSQVLRMREQFPCGLYQGYGLTETCGVVTGFTAEDHRALTGPHDPRLGSCGRPMEGNEVVVRRPDGTAVVPGEVGEITVRGPKVMSGYWGDDAATAAAFAGGWLLTGDLATVDAAGYITIVGRSKDVIISGGVQHLPGAGGAGSSPPIPTLRRLRSSALLTPTGVRSLQRRFACGPAARWTPRLWPHWSRHVSTGAAGRATCSSWRTSPVPPPARFASRTCAVYWSDAALRSSGRCSVIQRWPKEWIPAPDRSPGQALRRNDRGWSG